MLRGCGPSFGVSRSRSDRVNLKNAEDREVRGIGRQQSLYAVGIKYGCQVGIQDAFPAQLKLPHPADGLLHGGLICLD
jgi:hypothetical protein